jgi:hypothetical protein
LNRFSQQIKRAMSDPAASHPACLSVDQLLAECDVRRERRSGPGGQHRNKVETAVVLTHRPTGLRGDASERRSQEANRQMAIFRLRLRLALEIRLPIAENAPPSELWRGRVSAGRISVNAQHADFPALLAEALDRVTARDADASAAAAGLGVSASQLVRLLKQEPAALALVNARRAELGLHALR